MKNKHLRLSIVIALVALTLSLLFLSSTGKRAQTSSTPTAPKRTDAVTSGVGRQG